MATLREEAAEKPGGPERSNLVTRKVAVSPISTNFNRALTATSLRNIRMRVLATHFISDTRAIYLR